MADLNQNFGSDTPLLRELADTTRRFQAVSAAKAPAPAQTRIISVSNQKGGVGKTTSTVNLAAALASKGLRVLVIDLDPQGNASTALGIDHREGVVGIYEVLIEGASLESVAQPSPESPNLFVVPATIDLAGAEIEIVTSIERQNWHALLKNALDAFIRDGNQPDYVLIDCPPSLGLLTVNAFVAANEVLLPIQCEYYALEGLSQLLKNIERIQAALNPALRLSTILLTMFDARTRLAGQVVDDVRAHFPQQTLNTVIPRNVRVSEAPSFGKTVITHDPTSIGAISYLEAAIEIAQRGAANG
ncbi:ParA family protein [Candidatus Rhodoluna planktonica]|uniref:Chromosome partitioning protein n=1 Tax=Candidatus Rhodoluna planktonica TaxID=535712 RepID=A0A1D9E0Q9_9MICO|nr:AAA family ATPase [Candidatus Rhodoluna planktonica]AOY56652.1 chromosome partitioning protein [Candidatus Rhodoluna planktonica]